MYPAIEVIKSLLLRESYISEADSKAAEKVAHNSAEYVDYLISEQLLSKTLLGQAIAEAYKLPYADLELSPPTKEDVAIIPEEIARKNRVVFIKANDQTAVVASDNPQKIDRTTMETIFKNKQIRLSYALPEYITSCFSMYEQPLGTRFSQIVATGQRVAPEIVDEIITDALSYRASDIHIEPQADSVTVRFRVDGVLREAGKLPTAIYETVLNRIKVAGGMRIDEHFLAQDGSISYSSADTTAELRVSLIPTVEGEKIVMRVLGSYVQNYTLADLGLSKAHREQLETASAKPFGMILTTGPNGSGKTTTMYSLIKLLNHPDINITTIEDPVEYKIAGANQIQVRIASDMTFANGLRAIVRQDPDIILVGEIRDQETAEISVNAALTGHLLLSTFHANDAATAIPRLIEMDIEPFLLASTLEIIISQRLVRKICQQCRVSIPKEQALASSSHSTTNVSQLLSKIETTYIGKGCKVCNGTGYQGRSALFEIISMTPQMQKLIIKRPSAVEIAELAHKSGEKTMFDDGLEKVKTGITTLDELLRVVEPPEITKK